MPDLSLWVALSLTEHLGTKTLNALLQHFGDDPETILNADVRALQRVPGVGPKIAQSIKSIDLPQVQQAIADWNAVQIQIATPVTSGVDYPPRLLLTDDAPAALFLRGAWQPADDRAAAVVGTREPSRLAAKAAYRLGSTLAEAGYTVVSGLAFGVDRQAHEGALSIPEGRSIAVLGCGVLNIYPPEHYALALECAGRGAIMSEVHPNAAPSSPRLVARNRIISGLAKALVVVETDADGGAMHAARFAHRQQRSVFTFDLKASGNRALIAEGAQALAPDCSDLDCLLEALAKD